AGLSMAERFAIANMTTEWGALVGVFPCDETTMEFVRRCPRVGERELDEITGLDLAPDADAVYAKTLHLDLSKVSPSVSGPNEVKTMRSVASLQRERLKIQKAYLVSCVNARLEDFAEAARAIEGKRVAEGVELYVAAASAKVEEEARRDGHWAVLEAAGARFLPPGCGPCIGLGTGLLEAGEVGISATNRNFKGRMGSKDALAYLASPAVVAASAAAGYICAPGEVGETAPAPRVEVHVRPSGERSVTILDGFPTRMAGEALFLPKDNMNTDGIFGKDVTYRDDLTPEQMAAAAFLNYDEAFQTTARRGDILVGGRNFGTGSSREQAATALKFFGIQMVIAESFSQTYKRNAFNNGFICIECPELVEALRSAFAGNAALTIRTGWTLDVDFESAALISPVGSFPFDPIGEVPQRLVMLGGAEAVARGALGGA
ncbi:homoaconitase, partial [Candidatus Sumerlaeota bacterium]|nr:homoaconitase [Candidatus Sumerlaeota bacterium]